MASNQSQQTRIAGISLNDNATAGSQSMNIKNAIGTASEGTKIVGGHYTEVRYFLQVPTFYDVGIKKQQNQNEVAYDMSIAISATYSSSL